MPPRRDQGKQGRRAWSSSSSQSTPSPVAAASRNAAAAPGASHAARNAGAAPGVSHAERNAGATPGASHRSMPRASGTSASAKAGAGVASSSASAVQATATSLAGQKLTKAVVRTCFYPKFENTKSDHETRTRMIEMVTDGLANIEVSLKHSGSLFMYAGRDGGAYAETSFGNLCTAVGVFVLERSFHEAWGNEASEKISEFSNYLTLSSMSVSMELVTDVLGDHGQRPKHDYVVVTAVAKLDHGKPKFYSTVEMIEFCRRWRLPTNHVWLFSTRASIISFFKTYDALCEKGTATLVCSTLDGIADITIPGSKKYFEAQGQILEGVFARAVSNESFELLRKLLKNVPEPPLDESYLDLGPRVREICAAHNSDGDKIRALLQSASMCNLLDWSDEWRDTSRFVMIGFLEAQPVDAATQNLQDLISLMKKRGLFPASFKCYQNCRNSNSPANQNLSYKMLICVHDIRHYRQKRADNPELWPLYRGFFVDINQFTDNNWRAPELSKESSSDGLPDEDLYPMLKLKFLPFKLRTVLIRDGLPTLVEHGPYAYKAFYQRQMTNWGTSASKHQKLAILLEKWGDHIIQKYGKNQQPPSKTYLEEAEPFLEKFAKQSHANLALIGAAGELYQTEISRSMLDGEGDLQQDASLETEGFIVFFTGMPGCVNSALCNEILKKLPGGFSDNHSLHFISENLFEGEYWEKVADEQKRYPARLTLTDKNAPTEGLWCQIEDICRTTKAAAIPVIPDCEGTDSNPFSLQSLAVFMFCVFKQGNSDDSFDADQVLKFYHLYEGKGRRQFEDDLCQRFGSMVKMPLLKLGRDALPSDVQHALDCGISLFRLRQQENCGSVAPSESIYANDWFLWKNRMLKALSENEEYLKSIQVSIDYAVKEVLEQLNKLLQKRNGVTDSLPRMQLTSGQPGAAQDIPGASGGAGGAQAPPTAEEDRRRRKREKKKEKKKKKKEEERKEEASPLYSRFRLPNIVFTTVVLFLLGCLITYLVQVLPGML